MKYLWVALYTVLLCVASAMVNSLGGDSVDRFVLYVCMVGAWTLGALFELDR